MLGCGLFKAGGVYTNIMQILVGEFILYFNHEQQPSEKVQSSNGEM